MQQEEIAFSIRVQEKDLFHFLIRHFYSSFSGILGLVISAGTFVLFVIGLTREGMFDSMQLLLLFILSCLFTIVQPLQLRIKARGQSKKNAMWEKPLHYKICEEGIHISQEEEQVLLPWEDIRKLVETPKAFFIYISSINANILPKEQMDGQMETFREAAREHMDRSMLKLKNG